MHGLNEQFDRQKGRKVRQSVFLGGDECENASHVLWECSTYSSTRASFKKIKSC